MIGTGIGLGLAGYRLQTIAFAPDRISGLQLWLDASDSSTVYQSSGGNLSISDGDPVGQWLDKSGNGRHMGQADGTRKPSLKLAAKNGRNIIRLDGVNDYLRNSFTGNQPFSLYIVHKFTANSNSYIYDGSDSSRWYFITGGGTTYISAGIELNTSSFSIGTNYRLYRIRLDGASSTVFSNGVSVLSGNLGSASVNGLTLGANFLNNNPQSCDFAEVVGYGRILDSVDDGKITDYLNAKWSIY